MTVKNKKNPNKNNDNEFEFTLHFIEEVKNNKYGAIIGKSDVVDPRMNEPTTYSSDEEETPIFSFCN